MEYERVPLGTLDATSRNNALQAMLAAALEKAGHTVALGKDSHVVDGVLSDLRVSLLEWIDDPRGHYRVEFLDVHDRHDRYFAWMTPKAVHIFKQPRDNTAGLRGKRSARRVVFNCPRGRDCIRDIGEAETFMLKQMNYYDLEYMARLDIGPDDFASYMALIEARAAMAE